MKLELVLRNKKKNHSYEMNLIFVQTLNFLFYFFPDAHPYPRHNSIAV